ncbi:MAG: (d)CMP kinase [Caldilineae bacterium]|nr:(d)CMP kinase [Anaerolineae bacterium]MCB0205231.1 (d)CMP kinase [Anaerolineae bacterium]MCB0254485.1 (d)CMP kinase [Anaerolineae bacterium]MCB9153623.1 (d)CMP kinase [Caldilineae bacterium]
MSKLPSVVAMDGPAASGKSTIGELLAERLGYIYFDTGLMYRAVTWLALDRQTPVGDEAAVTALAETVDIDVLPPTVEDGRQSTVLVNGQDVTWALREPRINANVSPVAAYGGVRAAMVIQQQRVAARGHIVMVGRDIGTVVLPDAELKVFLVASAEERARRRWLEEQARGGRRTLDEVLAEIHRRDEIDSTRPIAPLRPAEDAIIVDSTGLKPGQVVEEILRKAGYST